MIVNVLFVNIDCCLIDVIWLECVGCVLCVFVDVFCVIGCRWCYDSSCVWVDINEVCCVVYVCEVFSC